MENKNIFKKIILSIILAVCFGLCFAFAGSTNADAENLQDYDGSSWHLNYYTNITTSYLNSLSSLDTNITCKVQGDGGYSTTALFNIYIGNNMLPQPPQSNLYFIKLSVAHQNTTTSYLYFDFFTRGTTNTSVSNSTLRVTFYTAGNNSPNSYCRLYNIASPVGADATTIGFYLSKYGASITTAQVGGSTYSTTILDNDSVAVSLFNKCFTNIFTDTDNYEKGYSAGYNSAMDEVGGSLDTYYNNGYNAGYSAGASSIDTDSFYNTGYERGYNAGVSSSSQDYGIGDLLFSILNVPIAVLTNLFNINIFGANVLAVIVSLLIVTISIWVIKKLIFGRGD